MPHPPDEDRVREILARHRDEDGALLPVLHAVQDAFGHVPAYAVPMIAQALNLSRAEVHGVISYYHHFRNEPAGRHVVQVCRAESCLACGSDALLAQAEQLLGCKLHETRADGAVSLEPVVLPGPVRVLARAPDRRSPACKGDARSPAASGGGAGGSVMSVVTLHVPRDSAALAVGADEVADTLQAACTARGQSVCIVRNGSRGMFWLEPLVEVQTAQGRVAYGPVRARGRARAAWTPACCKAVRTRCTSA